MRRMYVLYGNGIVGNEEKFEAPRVTQAHRPIRIRLKAMIAPGRERGVNGSLTKIPSLRGVEQWSTLIRVNNRPRSFMGHQYGTPACLYFSSLTLEVPRRFVISLGFNLRKIWGSKLVSPGRYSDLLLCTQYCTWLLLTALLLTAF